MVIFEHKVSKGSRYNQVYIPREMEGVFEVGDTVQVKLLKKKEEIHYSPNLAKLREFKEKIVKEIFNSLGKLSGIKQIFVVGSFLTRKTDYKDIDIIIITEKIGMEEKALSHLTEKMQLNFHLIAIPEKKFFRLLKICPLTKSMMHYFVSNKKPELQKEYEINAEHLEFLLMMPEDLLKIDISGGRAYFDAIRRLIAIRMFLENKPIDPLIIDYELKSALKEGIYVLVKGNEAVDKEMAKQLREIIRKKLKEVRSKYGQEESNR